MILIDTVATMYGCDWDKAVKLPVMEFLNVFCYSRAKNKFECDVRKAEFDKQMARMKHR